MERQRIIVNQWYYLYGAGCGPNRLLEFYRENEGDVLKVITKARRMDKWEIISQLEDTDIIVEEYSGDEKMEIMMNARNKGIKPAYGKDRQMNEIDVDEQDNVLKKLEPLGSYRITVQNGIGNNPYFEIVTGLIIFRP